MKDLKGAKSVAILSVMMSLGLFARPVTLNGGQPLSLQVSPAMAAAPAVISVRAVIEASDDNRALEVVAQSSDFFRSSRVELDGRAAPPLSVFQYSNLPPGLYEVSAFLIGASGQRAAVSKIVKVMPR
jgi:hypothetical protein